MTSQAIATTDYELEKEDGTRRANGARNLKKLKPKHIKLIELHLKGLSNREIAESLNLTQATVSITLGDPLVRNVIQQVISDSKDRFDALGPKVVDTIAECLQAENKGLRLRAIDRYHKMHPILSAGTGEFTAEDVIQQILKRSEVSVNVEVKQK